MTPSPQDRARERWRIPAGQPILIEGQGDGKLYDEARHLANSILPKMVREDRYITFKSLKEVDTFLRQYGLERLLDRDVPYNPPGRMIFYRKGLVLVRIKTKGNPPGAPYRANRPHLSVSLMNSTESTDFSAEIVKFNPLGRPQPHTLKLGTARFLPIDPKGKYAGDDAEWGRTTHLEFDPAIVELT
jgi:hypothetical protein